MSNLGQLATIVGQRLGVDTSLIGTRDGAAVRAFLSMRHDQLYRAYLWKDSVIEMAVNPATPYTPTSNYMPTKGRVILPPIFQHVLGARMGCYSLDVQRPMFFYRANYARFFNSGWSAEFVLMSSCVWEFDTVQTLSVDIDNQADSAQVAIIDTVDSNEVSITRQNLPLNFAYPPTFSTDRIDNFIKPQTQGSVAIQNFTALTNLIPAGVIYNPNGSTSPGIFLGVLHNATQYIIVFGENDTLLHNIADGNPETITGPGAFIFTTGAATSSVTLGGTALAPVTAAIYAYTPQFAAASGIITLGANDLSAPKSQRLQLVGKPISPQQLNTNIHILGKRNTPPFIADSDVVGVNGFEGILIALAYYDFKQRDESGGTPDAITALTEAVGPSFLTSGKPGGFLGKLVEEETIQEAYNTRIIPDHGFGGCGYYDQPWDKAFPYSSGGW